MVVTPGQRVGARPAGGQGELGRGTVGDQRLRVGVEVHAGGGHRPQLGAAEHVGHRVGAGDGEARRDGADDGDARDRQRDAEDGQHEPFGSATDVRQREPDEVPEGVPGRSGDRR